LAGSPLDDSLRGVFRGQNTSLHRALHSALSQKKAALLLAERLFAKTGLPIDQQ
jgi:hypothetical protein